MSLLSVRFSFQEEKASCLTETASPQDPVYQGREDRCDNSSRDGINLYIMESKLVWKDSQSVFMSGEMEKDQS